MASNVEASQADSTAKHIPEGWTQKQGSSSVDGADSLGDMQRNDSLAENDLIDLEEGTDGRASTGKITSKIHENCKDSKEAGLSNDQHGRMPSKSEPAVRADGKDSTNDGVKPEVYLDPTPKTPRTTSPSRTPESPVEAHDESGTTAEIKNIMEQFGDGDDFGAEHAQSDRSTAAPVGYPPRGSSLEPLSAPTSQLNEFAVMKSPENAQAAEHTVGSSNQASLEISTRVSSLPQNKNLSTTDSHLVSPRTSSLSLPKALPPTPDPEPDLPFDFHRFLEQLRHRSADPVARYLRSFLLEFGKKQWMAHEQVKFIHDFLAFIANKMAQCEVWRGVSDAEFDNAKEGMEKLVMNRLYSQTFSPAITPPASASSGTGKRKNLEKMLGHGRRGQHQEDIERDDILGQKVLIYSWVKEEHLDIKPVGANGNRLLNLAQQGIERRVKKSLFDANVGQNF